MSTAITTFGFLGILSVTSLCIYLLKRMMDAEKKITSAFQQTREAELQLPIARERYEKKYRSKYLQDVAELEEKVDLEHIHLISQAMCGTTSNALVQSMGDIVTQHCNRSTQEFLASISEEAEGVTRSLQVSLYENIWNSFQQYKDQVNDSPMVIPPNVRLMYTKGHRTVVIVEQEPRVKTVGFESGLTGQADQKAAVTTTTHGYWFSLAFPYIYFVIIFDKGNYKWMEPYFSNTKISSSRDQIYLAPLPNVKMNDHNGSNHICLGEGHGNAVHRLNTLSEKTDEIVRIFWSRIYSDHYGKGRFRKVDLRLSTIRKWQANSEKDPLFVLTVDWKNGITVKGLVEKRLDQRDFRNTMDGAEKAVNDLLHQGVLKVTKRIQEEIKAVKKAQTPKNLESRSREQLEEIVTSHTKNVFSKL